MNNYCFYIFFIQFSWIIRKYAVSLQQKVILMAEVIVSIDNNWAIDSIIDAIKMLKGVTSAKLWKKETTKSKNFTTKKYSTRIEKLQHLCGAGITQDDINNDSRLAYLLGK